MNKRKLNRGEKGLVAVSLLGAIALLVAARIPHVDTDMATPEVTCQNVVRSLRNGDVAQLKRLTTPQGLAALQKASKDNRFSSYPKVGNRILAEWGNTAYWSNTTSDSEGRFGMGGVGGFGKLDGAISFDQSEKG